MIKKFIYGLAALYVVGCSVKNEGQQMEENKKPPVHIGYYLKTLDNLLTEQIDKIHAANGLTRAEWQILNSFYQEPTIDRAVLIDVVKEFTDTSIAEELIEGLVGRELISGPNHLQLTEKGKKLHATALEMQKEFRKKATEGISQQEYQQLIGTLDKMIQNLSSDRK